MSNRIFIFTDLDLDGACSALIVRWFYPDHKIAHKAVNERNFRETFLNWAKTVDITTFERIFITDLAVAKENQDILDLKNVVIVDHHNVKENWQNNYQNAQIVCEDVNSCAVLLYRTFQKNVWCSSQILSDAQKYLILLVDDYDSYTLKYPHTLDLNTVYYALQGDRIQKFGEEFYNGFNEFNLHQQNIIKFHKLKLNQIKEELEVHTANINIKGDVYKVFSAVADYSINEIASYLIDTYKADIAIIVNTKNNTVSYRKNKNCKYDISILAKKLSNGVGHEFAAGGLVTDAFLQFIKLFQLV